MRGIARAVVALAAGLAAAAPDAGWATSPEALAAAAGKLLVTGFAGTAPRSPGVRAISADIAAGRVGGVILFGRNVAGPRQLARLTAHLRAQAPDGDLLIFVDQEGGRVARLRRRNGWRGWPSAASMARRGLGDAEKTYADMAAALARAGVDVNLGPVVDIGHDPRNPVITRLGRSYGADPAAVAAFAERFVLAHRRAGVRSCLKHFPGHGSSRKDTHTEVVNLRGLWRPELELAPYARLLAPGAARPGCVMTSHLLVPALAGRENRIVTFSSEAIRLLREDLGFEGVVVTDDLMMEGVRRRARFDRAVPLALAAGHDVVLTGRRWIDERTSAWRYQRAVAAALRDGALSEARLRDALRRRAAWRP